MSMDQETSQVRVRDLEPDEICPAVDVDAVAEILRRAHPDLESDDIVARIREVLGQAGP